MKIDKQVAIYDSALKLFGNMGVKRVSIDMIVKDAGVAKGTFYLYYKNKEALYQKIIHDMFEHGMIFKDELIRNFPDVKERFYVNMVAMVGYFQDNGIVKNLIIGNTDYYVGDIDHDYMFTLHTKILKELLGVEFTDEKFIEEIANIKGFYASVIIYKPFFKSNDEYEKFVMDLASVLANGLFSDYKILQGNKKFKDLVSYIPKI